MSGVLDDQIIAYLRYAHGLFHLVMLVLFFMQGFRGFKIRKDRKLSLPYPAKAVKRHRQMGPVLALLGPAGFLFGLLLALLDKGILEFPVHLLIGVLLTSLIITSYALSKKIKGLDLYFRSSHFIVGVAILVLYLINIFVGFGVLL